MGFVQKHKHVTTTAKHEPHMDFLRIAVAAEAPSRATSATAPKMTDAPSMPTMPAKIGSTGPKAKPVTRTSTGLKSPGPEEAEQVARVTLSTNTGLKSPGPKEANRLQ